MLKALIVFVWPVGIAAIVAIAALSALRSSRRPVPADAPTNGPTYHRDRPPAINTVVDHRDAAHPGGWRGCRLWADLPAGALRRAHSPHIDNPIYNWMIHHRMHFWKSAMDRATKSGIRGPSGVRPYSGSPPGAFYRKNKWLPQRSARPS